MQSFQSSILSSSSILSTSHLSNQQPFPDLDNFIKLKDNELVLVINNSTIKEYLESCSSDFLDQPDVALTKLCQLKKRLHLLNVNQQENGSSTEETLKDVNAYILSLANSSFEEEKEKPETKFESIQALKVRLEQIPKLKKEEWASTIDNLESIFNQNILTFVENLSVLNKHLAPIKQRLMKDASINKEKQEAIIKTINRFSDVSKVDFVVKQQTSLSLIESTLSVSQTNPSPSLTDSTLAVSQKANQELDLDPAKVEELKKEIIKEDLKEPKAPPPLEGKIDQAIAEAIEQKLRFVNLSAFRDLDDASLRRLLDHHHIEGLWVCSEAITSFPSERKYFLKVLYCNYCENLRSIPPAVFEHLEVFKAQGCVNLQTIPSTAPQLKILQVHDCIEFDRSSFEGKVEGPEEGEGPSPNMITSILSDNLPNPTPKLKFSSILNDRATFTKLSGEELNKMKKQVARRWMPTSDIVSKELNQRMVIEAERKYNLCDLLYNDLYLEKAAAYSLKQEFIRAIHTYIYENGKDRDLVTSFTKQVKESGILMYAPRAILEKYHSDKLSPKLFEELKAHKDQHANKYERKENESTHILEKSEYEKEETKERDLIYRYYEEVLEPAAQKNKQLYTEFFDKRPELLHGLKKWLEEKSKLKNRPKPSNPPQAQLTASKVQLQQSTTQSLDSSKKQTPLPQPVVQPLQSLNPPQKQIETEKKVSKPTERSNWAEMSDSDNDAEKEVKTIPENKKEQETPISLSLDLSKRQQTPPSAPKNAKPADTVTWANIAKTGAPSKTPVPAVANTSKPPTPAKQNKGKNKSSSLKANAKPYHPPTSTSPSKQSSKKQ